MKKLNIAFLGLLLLVTCHSSLVTDFMSWRNTIRNWTGRLDRALSVADSQMGLSSLPGELGAPGGLLGSTPSGGMAAPMPVPADQPSSSDVQIIETRNPDGSISIYGLPGTLITSGFLVQDEFNPELAGRQGITTYDRMRRTNSQVEKTIELCAQPILGADWRVELDETAFNASAPLVSSTGAGRATRDKAEEIRAAAEANLFHKLGWRDEKGAWHSQSWNDVLRNAILMLTYGCAAHERVMRVDGDQFAFSRFADLPPKTFFRWDVEPDGRTLRNLIQLGFRGQWYGQAPVPAERFTMFTHRQEGADFWGRSMLRAAYTHYYAVMMLYRIRGIAAEKSSIGIPCITLGPNASAEDRAAAIAYVTAIAAHQRTGMVLPNGATFKLHGVEGHLFDSMEDIAHHMEQISFVALDFFSNLGRGGKSAAGGSRALQTGQGKFFQLALQNAADYVAQRITDSDLRAWTTFNYGPDAPAPVLRAADVQSMGFEEVMSILSAAAQSGLVVSDQPLRDQVRSRTGFSPETRDGLVAIKGETIDLGSASEISPGGAPVSISGRSAGQIDTGKGSQGPPPQDGRTSRQSAAPPAKPSGPPPATATRQKEHSKKAKGKPQTATADSGATTLADTRQPTPDTRIPVPGEEHIDWPAHNQRIDKTAADVRRILTAARPLRLHQWARALAPLQVRDFATAALPHDHALARRVAAALEPARLHGQDLMWQARFKATGKQRHQELATLAEGLPKNPDPQPVEHRLVLHDGQIIAEAALVDYDNWLRNTATGAATAQARQAVAGKTLDQIVDDIVNAGLEVSDANIDRFAERAAIQSIVKGNLEALKAMGRDVKRIWRTEINDQNTCDVCRPYWNGTKVMEWPNYEAIDWWPGDDCEGGLNCRGAFTADFIGKV